MVSCTKRNHGLEGGAAKALQVEDSTVGYLLSLL